VECNLGLSRRRNRRIYNHVKGNWPAFFSVICSGRKSL
jgi:hypothetical protein